jgi:hypothetical protein
VISPSQREGGRGWGYASRILGTVTPHPNPPPLGEGEVRSPLSFQVAIVYLDTDLRRYGAVSFYDPLILFFHTSLMLCMQGYEMIWHVA